MRPTPPKSLARWTTIVLLSLFSYAVAGQTLAPLATDTTYLGHTMAGKTRLIDKITTTKAFQISRVGVPLIIGGLIIKGEDEHFRFLRNTYTPDLKFPYDDYITLVPLATTLGLKIAGVKGHTKGEGAVYSGSTLLYAGLTLPHLVGDYPSVQLHLTRLEG